MEIWGWRKRERMERLEKRYLKWVMGLNSRIPGHMIREELQRGKLKGGQRDGRGRLGVKRGGKLARECLKEIKEKAAKGKEISS